MELFPIERLDAYPYVLFQIKDSSFAISCEYVSDVQPVPGNVLQPPQSSALHIWNFQFIRTGNNSTYCLLYDGKRFRREKGLQQSGV